VEIAIGGSHDHDPILVVFAVKRSNIHDSIKVSKRWPADVSPDRGVIEHFGDVSVPRSYDHMARFVVRRVERIDSNDSRKLRQRRLRYVYAIDGW